MRTACDVESLLVDQGRVVGLTLTHQGAMERIRATRGVVLATSSGDGWRLAMPAGGEVSVGVVRQGMVQLHVPGEQLPDGTPVTRGNYELRMRHGIVVNRQGQRFGNEHFFQALGAQLHAFETWGDHRFVNLPCYLIFDHQLVETYSFAGLPPGYSAGMAWVPQGHTLAEVAQRLQMPAAALEATVARFNAHAHRGKDVDFHRAPESLGALERPPFYGVGSSPTGVLGHHQSGDEYPGPSPAPSNAPPDSRVICVWAGRGDQPGPWGRVSGGVSADARPRARVPGGGTRGRQRLVTHRPISAHSV